MERLRAAHAEKYAEMIRCFNATYADPSDENFKAAAQAIEAAEDARLALLYHTEFSFPHSVQP